VENVGKKTGSNVISYIYRKKRCLDYTFLRNSSKLEESSNELNKAYDSLYEQNQEFATWLKETTDKWRDKTMDKFSDFVSEIFAEEW
jgi:chromosome segregation and condensation protein ScpB